MDNSAENGHLSFLGSILLGIVSWFSPENIDTTIKIITALGALVSGALAARYYWYATKEKKQSIKKMKDGK